MGSRQGENNGHFRSEHLKVIVDVYIPAGALQNFNWLDQPASIFVLHARNCAQENVEHWQSANQMIYEEETWVTLEFDLFSLQHFCYRNLILAGSSPSELYSDNFRWRLIIPDQDLGIIFSESFEGNVFPAQGWTLYSAAANRVLSQDRICYRGRRRKSMVSVVFQWPASNRSQPFLAGT